MFRSKRSYIVRYGIAILLMGAVILIAAALPLATGASFPLLLVAILICTWWGGLGPGLVATALAALASLDLAEPPLGSFTLTNGETALRFGLFLASAVIVALITAERERAQGALRRLNAELEQRVGERTAQLEAVNAELKREIAERKLIEEQVQDLNRDLERHAADLEAVNRELEAFSYSVSHDLRTPVATIGEFSRLLLKDYGARLPEEGQRFLRLIHEEAGAMDRLIQDLLSLSRATRQPLKKEEVPPNELVSRVLEELRNTQAGRDIEIVVDSLPPCAADPILLKQVWVNLLSNAFKFTRHCARARIQIGSVVQDGHTAYFVKDNGVGFDSEHADRLFGVFQRFHSEEDYEGTGIGLAIVERILRRHGGRIWAEAEVNKGATLYFTLE